MVGLTKIWILLTSLLLLASCVPQTKQTSCGSSEAYNSSLRSCVPIVGGPSSFINISSYIPTSSYSRYKNDVTPMTFQVYITNPYAQAYTTVWKHTFNGSTTNITGIVTTPTKWDIFPLYFATELGLHLVTVDIVDSANTIVDTHTFQFTINNSPRPYIDTTSVSPGTYSTTMNPLAAQTTNFAFNIKNNGSSISTTTTYQTQWKLYKNGIDVTPPAFATQDFADITPSGTNAANFSFNPATYGNASYVLRARIVYTPTSEVVDERQWTVTVQDPPLSKVVARALIQGSALNPLTTVEAYNGVDYNTSAAYNFRPRVAGVLQNQANFCVKVANGEGIYTGDGKFVKVSFFLDGGTTSVYDGYTTAVADEVCLTDGGVGTLASVLFTNASPTSTVAHAVVARVYDMAGNVEYTSSDLSSGTGTYPITWNISVKPQNAAPTIQIGAASAGISSCTASSTAKSGCVVPSDTNFTVSVQMVSDDFYTYPGNEAKFDFNVQLYKNSAPVAGQVCNKTVNPAATGPTYSCTLKIDSFDSNGPFDVTAASFQVRATISDVDSPITATGTTSSVVTWDIRATETNSSLAIVLNGPGVATESTAAAPSTINFSIDVTDAERDNFKYQIKYCKTVACTGAGVGNLTALTTYTRSTNASMVTAVSSTALPEDFLQNITPCAGTLRGATCVVNFFVTVNDLPYSGSATMNTVTSPNVAVTITNSNPAPVISPTYLVPNPLTFAGSAFGGVPLTFSASGTGAITDASAVTSEQPTSSSYQWYARNTLPNGAWIAISGATSVNMVWTPSLINEARLLAGNDNPLNVMLCVEDQPGVAVSTASTCSSIWTVTAYNNVVNAQTMSNVATSLAKGAADAGTETAVWQETPTGTSSAAYIASIGNDKKIYVKKVLVKNNGQLIPEKSPAGADVRIVSFNALSAGAAASIKDLSMTGDANNLFIAYRASVTSSPSTFYPQVRRIDISPGKNGTNTHAGKFGFSYNGITIASTCPGAQCVITNPATNGTIPTVHFAPTGSQSGQTLTITTPMGSKVLTFADFSAMTAGQLCGDCNATGMANRLASVINADTSDALMGLTATVSGGDTVVIAGSLSADYLDASSGTYMRGTAGMGSIYMTAGSWYLPFINTTIGPPYQNKMSILTAPAAGTNMFTAGGTTLYEPDSVVALNTVVGATDLSTWFDGTNLYVGAVNYSGSTGHVYRMSPVSPFTIATSSNIMAGKVLTDIQIAANSASTFVAAVIQVAAATFDNMVGAYSSVTLSAAPYTEFMISDATRVDATTSTYLNNASMSAYRILPMGNEARLFFASRGAGAVYRMYAGRLDQSSGSWELSCKDCKPLDFIGQKISPYVSIGASVRTKVAANVNYALSSDGATTNESIKTVAFLGFAEMDSGATYANPNLGVMNLEVEQVNSSLLYSTATVGQEDKGLYRPPLIRN